MGVSALVLDELHVLDGTARGDQLRILVERMRVERREGPRPVPLQVVAASATVADPEALAGRYLRDPTLVVAGSRRAVRARIVMGRDPASIRAHLLAVVRGGFRKVLLFCDSRAEVEEVAAALQGRPPFGHAVFAHHGSLARARRISAEARFLEAPVACCVATRTLELGIDIGDVDLVALSGAPPDLPSLLQRAGRGRRREGQSAILAMVDRPLEERLLRLLLEAQAEGRWFEDPPVFFAEVLVQQAIGIGMARISRTVDAAAMRRRFPPDLLGAWPARRLEPLLAAAAEAGWLQRAGSGPEGPIYGLGAEAERAWARGGTHANLPELNGISVIDSLTGDTLGTVATGSGAVPMGGQGRDILFSSPDRLVTRPGVGEGSARFAASGRLGRGAALSRALLQSLGLPLPSWCSLGGKAALFHGLGSAGGALLAACLRPTEEVVRAGAGALVLKRPPRPEGWPGPAAVRVALEEGLAGFAAELPLGPFFAALPWAEKLAVVGGLSGAEAVRALLSGPPPAEIDPEPIHEEAAWW